MRLSSITSHSVYLLATTLSMAGFFSGCSDAQEPGSSVFADEDLKTEADTGLVLPEPLDLEATQEFLTNVQGQLTTVMRNPKTVLQLSALSASILEETGFLPLANALAVSNRTEGCPAAQVCTDISIELIGLNFETDEKPTLGTLKVEAIFDELDPDAFEVSLARDASARPLGATAIRLGSPVSLDVVDLNVSEQVRVLPAVLSADGLTDAIESFKEKQGFAAQTLVGVQSLLLPRPGAECRQPVNPCQLGFIRLVQIDAEGKKSGEFGLLQIRKFTDQNSPSADVVVIRPLSD